MSGRMSAGMMVALAVLFVAPVTGVARAQEAKVVVELVPEHAGPYPADQTVTVDVWLHSQVSFDAFLRGVRLDFSDSAPALLLDGTFLFDLSAIPTPRSDYTIFPEMPLPVAAVLHFGPISPENMLPLPAGGSLHIGSIGVRFPATPGVYRLDALNRDDPNEEVGAVIEAKFFPGGGQWWAYTGEIIGGTFQFVVEGPPIPTVSNWGLIVTTLVLLVVGSVTIKRRTASRSSFVAVLFAIGLGQSHAVAQDVVFNVDENNGSFELSLDNGPPFHVTNREVINARLIEVTDSTVRVALWDEVTATGQGVPFYGIFLDGVKINRVTETSYDLRLRFARFDPTNTSPAIPAALQAYPSGRLFIVQFVTQPLEAYRAPIEQLGGTIYSYLAHHAHIVKIDPVNTAQVAALPFVRSVSPYHPAYRLEEFMRDNLDRSGELFPLLRYNVQVFEPGPSQKSAVGARIQALGGTVNVANAGKFLLEATLTPEQLYEVVRWDEVLFVDRWGPYEVAMNNARIVSGANYLETVTGFTGQGVRGEVFDSGFNLDHVAFATRPRIVHGGACTGSHGASTSGIVFGDGTATVTGRGLLPEGQGIFASWSTECGGPGLTAPNRYCHTCELVSANCPVECDPIDPAAPYNAVFQTASVVTLPYTTKYTTVSADTDAMLFDFDILLCQAQANNGSITLPQKSGPEAWAKNIVSVGGIRHNNNDDSADPDTDDTWCDPPGVCGESSSCASIGPADDGRIKPDLVHFYDCVDTVDCCGAASYTTNFGGTSAATPITCGYFGLMFQMWHEEVFCGFGGGASVFDSRPHMSTAKALMINTANQYTFSGTDVDLTRTHQGWGMVNAQNLYDLRDNIFIVNETDILANLDSIDYYVIVAAGEPALRVTMVYADPPGTPCSSQHRINDLTLKVTSPSGTVYWAMTGYSPVTGRRQMVQPIRLTRWKTCSSKPRRPVAGPSG